MPTPSGVHRTYMGTLERGRANPTLRIIDRVARGLGVTVPELFQAVESGPPASGQPAARRLSPG